MNQYLLNAVFFNMVNELVISPFSPSVTFLPPPPPPDPPTFLKTENREIF